MSDTNKLLQEIYALLDKFAADCGQGVYQWAVVALRYEIGARLEKIQEKLEAPPLVSVTPNPPVEV